MEQPAVIDAVVVGAGFADLVAARQLVEAGKDVLVLEARERVGGRTFVGTYPGTDVVVDWGAEWFDPERHHFMAAEVARYGARFAPADEEGAHRWFLDGTWADGDEPDALVDMDELERVLDHLRADIAPIVFAKGMDQPNAAELDIPFSEYLEKLGASEAISDLLRAQSYTLTGALPSEFSALVYLREIAGFDGDPAYTFFQSLARVDIGSGGLAERIAADLGNRIRLNEPVTAITQFEDRVEVVANGALYSARQVIVAAPLNTLGDIAFTPDLPPALGRLVDAGHTGRCVKVWAKLSNLPVASTLGWPGIAEATIKRRIHEDGQEKAIVAAFGLQPDLTVDRVDLLQAGLDRMELGATVDEVQGHDWIADPYSQGTWLATRPGQAADFAHLETHWGSIHLAGADFAQVWSGWVDGAIESGLEAGNAALAELG